MNSLNNSAGKEDIVRITSVIFVVVFAIGCGTGKQKQVVPEKHPGEVTFPGLAARGACSNESIATPDDEFGLFHFRYDNIPICSHHTRSIPLGQNGGSLVLGSTLSEMEFEVEENYQWPTLEQALDVVSASLAANATVEEISSFRCWHADQSNHLIPSYEMVVTFLGRSHVVLANGNEVFESGPAGFEASGSLSYQKEGAGGETSLYKTESLNGTGFLEGPNFRVTRANGAKIAFSPDGNFMVGPEDQRFSQVTSYANAEINLDWYRSLDPKSVDTECFPIDITVHATKGGRALNNAEYVPFNQKPIGRPEIILGDGDGEALVNLSRDPDVIAHEFAHHIVFRGLKDAKFFETAVLHEGIADFFVFARTGNACLGETICPPGSGHCTVEGRCLRTGENEMSFLDSDLPSAAHKQSQIISGMLWDLQHELFPEDRNLFTQTVLDSLSYLVPRSTYRDFVIALANADKARFGGVNACKFFDAAATRGLESVLKNVNCTGFLTAE